ncbi:hypothetical protein AA0116_g781 [Alternaria tenuissima]|nr:hypothetical protein AA0116_g781 [Alternaria tenuissima]
MAISTHALSQIRQYSTRVPRDPRYRLKATLATTYVESQGRWKLSDKGKRVLLITVSRVRTMRILSRF